jgi:hypothetical protein
VFADAGTNRRPAVGVTGPAGRQEQAAMLYGEPETVRFLAAVQRLKRQMRRKERQTKQAKQRVREVLRKLRSC